MACGIDLQAHVLAADEREKGRRRDIGLLAEVLRIDAVEQMLHRGIACHDDVVDHALRHLVLFGQLGEHRIDVAHDQALELFEPVPLRRVHDARDHVVAALYLAVVGRSRADDVAVRHVNKVDDHRGGADIHGRAVPRLRGVAGEDVEHFKNSAHVEDRDRDVPAAFTQHMRQLAQHQVVQVEMRCVEARLVQRASDPLVVRDVIVDRGRAELEVDPLDARLQAPAGGLHELDQLVRLRAGGDLVLCLHARLLRDLDDQVALDARQAGEHVAAFRFFSGQEGTGLAALDRALLDDDLALAAVALAAAGREHVDARGFDGPEEVRVVVDSDRDVIGEEGDLAFHELNIAGR